MGTLINGLEVLSETEVPTATALNPLALWAFIIIFFTAAVAFCCIEVQPTKAILSKFVKVSGITKLCKRSFPSNAPSPILVTISGIVTEVKLLQS